MTQTVYTQIVDSIPLLLFLFFVDKFHPPTSLFIIFKSDIRSKSFTCVNVYIYTDTPTYMHVEYNIIF